MSSGRGLLLILAVGFCAGCADAPMDTRRGLPDPNGIPGYELTYQECTDGADTDDDGRVDCVDPDCHRWDFCGRNLPADQAGCAFLRVAAQITSTPVDLIFVVDSSGSMIDVAEVVQQRLANLSSSLLGSGVDFRLVLITASWLGNVPEPLANDSRFLFVPQSVQNGEAFAQVLTHFDGYASLLRPEAATVVVAVSDDDSRMAASDFKTLLEARLGHGFVFHAIASENASHGMGGLLPGCTGPYGAAWDVGTQYYRLADLTGGQKFSVCTEDWTGLFDGIAQSTVNHVAIPCSYELPNVPVGQVLVPSKVNVAQYLDDGSSTNLPRAASVASCGEGAWYFDDEAAPTRVLLCPTICGAIQVLQTAELDITLGCDTDVVVY